MSILSSYIDGFLSLIYPPQCCGCDGEMSSHSDMLCVECLSSMPITNFHLDAKNPVAQRLKDLNPAIENATAQFYYVNDGRWRRVIHSMKYRGNWKVARRMGYWYGSELMESPLYGDVDLVVAVPLHPRRIFERGYNQSELIACGVAEAMGVKQCRGALHRARYNQSQVTQQKSQRWGNVKGIFVVRHPERLVGKHILLVDDVLTTGATITSCIEAILSSVPSCRISVATLAVSRKEIVGNAI